MNALSLLLLALLAGGAFEPAPEAADPPEPDQWYCSATATGANGAEVSAHIMVETGGRVMDQGAAWTPPRLPGAPSIKRLRGPSPDISIGYNSADAAGIGAPSDVLASAVTGASSRLLNGATAGLSLDGGQEWTASLDKFPAVLYDRRSFHSGFMKGDGLPAALDGAQVGLAILRDAQGAMLAWSRFDFSARGERDRLFVQAWSETEAAVRHYEGCQKAVAAPANVHVF